MSIVEDAIGKLRNRAAGDPATDTRGASLHAGRQGQAASSPLPGDGRAAALSWDMLGPRTVGLDRTRLAAEGLLPPRSGQESATDQFRRVKWRLLRQLEESAARDPQSPRIILVTSSLAGEGKSFCSFNLAMSLAMEQDLNVLLIDADIKRAKISWALGLADSPGLIELCSQSELDLAAVAVRTDQPQLAVIPAGRSLSDAPEILASARATAVMSQLSKLDRRCIVVMDSSPLLQTNETQVMARMAGQILFVVRAFSTQQSVAREALSLLDNQDRVYCLLNGDAKAAEGYYGRYGESIQSSQQRGADADA